MIKENRNTGIESTRSLLLWLWFYHDYIYIYIHGYHYCVTIYHIWWVVFISLILSLSRSCHTNSNGYLTNDKITYNTMLCTLYLYAYLFIYELFFFSFVFIRWLENRYFNFLSFLVGLCKIMVSDIIGKAHIKYACTPWKILSAQVQFLKVGSKRFYWMTTSSRGRERERAIIITNQIDAETMLLLTFVHNVPHFDLYIIHSFHQEIE